MKGMPDKFKIGLVQMSMSDDPESEPRESRRPYSRSRAAGGNARLPA